MKFWIVSEYYDSPYDTVGGYYVKGLAEVLSSSDCVEVVCPFVNSPAPADIRNRINFNYIHHFTFNRKNLIIRSFGQILISFQFFFLLLFKVKKDDIIISFTHPTFLIFISALLKKLKKSRTLIVNYDIFPEILVATGASGENLFYRTVLKMFNNVYNKADLIISLSDEMTRVLSGKIISNNAKITTLTNWADVENIFFQPKEKNELIKKYALEPKIVFSYAGTIGRCQGISLLLDLIGSIDHNDRVHFLFFGKGVEVASMVKQISTNGNRDMISYAGFIVTEDRNNYINACDVAIISLLEGMTGLNFPSKLYNIMASGHPVLFIGKVDSELAEMITLFNIGWVCSSSDRRMFQGIINEILEKPELIRRKGIEARRIAENRFAKEYVLNQYMEVINRFAHPER